MSCNRNQPRISRIDTNKKRKIGEIHAIRGRKELDRLKTPRIIEKIQPEK